MTQVSRSSPGGGEYLDLRRKARAEGRLAGELIELYALEGFLARLSSSTYADHLVLKGGVLLAAFGDRRPTRDVDLAGIDLDNDVEHVLGVIQAIASTAPPVADGLVLDVADASAEVIRDADEYSGVRVSMTVQLASARVNFHVDVNVGDPIWPAPQNVSVPRLLDGPDIEVWGYTMELALAEKIVTAVQRGTVSTRWRDFGDIWTLQKNHTVDGSLLDAAISSVAEHRGAGLKPLATALSGYASIGQPKWGAWRGKLRLERLPADFSEVLQGCEAFADPALAGEVRGALWEPASGTWVGRGPN